MPVGEMTFFFDIPRPAWPRNRRRSERSEGELFGLKRNLHYSRQVGQGSSTSPRDGSRQPIGATHNLRKNYWASKSIRQRQPSITPSPGTRTAPRYPYPTFPCGERQISPPIPTTSKYSRRTTHTPANMRPILLSGHERALTQIKFVAPDGRCEAGG